MSFDVNESTVKTVLKLIEDQSDFRFFYNSDLIDLDKVVNRSFNRKTIDEILLSVLSGTSVGYRVLDNNFVILSSAEVLQQTTISGTVTEADGTTLPGVNVSIKGASAGTTTDINGKFAINVSGDAVLVFSFIGYIPQEIAVSPQKTTVNVTLIEDTKQLEEVVVVGYGIVRKSDLTGAVSSVTDKAYRHQPIIRMQDALQGRVAGMSVTTSSGSPDGSVRLRIRGVTSVNRSSDPLVIVDGMDGSLGGLNPADIQSIEVLKDASSTAVYGSRGSNGVILVTTKRGQVGRAQVTLESNLGIANIANTIDMLTPGEFAAAQRVRRPETITEETVREYQNGTRPGVDWWDQMMRTGLNQTYRLSISGGNAGLRYLVSGNVTEQTSTAIVKSYSQQQVRANLDAVVYKWLDVGVNIHAYRSYNWGSNPNFWSIFWYAPTLDPIISPATGGYTGDAVNCTILDNPLAIKVNKTESQSTTFRGNVDFRFKILDGLTFTVTGGVTNGNSQYSSYSSSLRKAQLDSPNAEQQHSYSMSWRNINNLTYLKQLGDHHLTVTGVAELTQGESRGLTGTATNLVNEFVEYWNLGNGATRNTSNSYSASSMVSYFGRAIYNFKGRYMVSGTMRADGSSKFRGDNKWGYFPSGAVAWNIAEENFMANQSLFQQLKLRASIGVSGNQAIDNYQTIATLSTLNTYYASETAIPGYWVNTLANPNLKWETTRQVDVGLDFSILSQRLNMSLDWYTKRTTDLLFQKTIPSYHGGGQFWLNGGELENTGFEVTLDAYPVRSGKFLWESIFTAAYQHNKVIDLAGLDFVNGGVPYSGSFQPVTRIEVGKPIGTYWLYNYEGLNSEGVNQFTHYLKDPNDPDKIIGQETTNRPVGADKTTQGRMNPTWTLGWNNNFSYGNWEANLLFTAMLGMDRLNLLRCSMVQASVPTLHEGWYKSFDYLKDNGGNTANAIYPSRTNTDNYSPQGDSNRWLEDAKFLRLRNISISYRIPKSVLKFADLRISAGAENLFILTKYTGLDPETYNTQMDPNNTAYMADTHGGQDLGSFPLPRIITFGLRFDF